jgi:hypothetical protein
VVTGKYRPTIRGTDGYFASQILAQGVEFRDGVLDLIDGAVATLSLEASGETCAVKGLAMSGGKPSPGAMVVLAPALESAAPEVYRGFVTDSDGTFDWPHVQAGDYVIFAVPGTTFEYTNPAILRRYLKDAKPIRIEPHRSYSQDVEVLSGPPRP